MYLRASANKVSDFVLEIMLKQNTCGYW